MQGEVLRRPEKLSFRYQSNIEQVSRAILFQSKEFLKKLLEEQEEERKQLLLAVEKEKVSSQMGEREVFAAFGKNKLEEPSMIKFFARTCTKSNTAN